MTASDTRLADPRPVYAASAAWVAELLAGVTSEQLALPTPCTEFDVRTLCTHLVGVADRSVALGEAGSIDGVSSLAEVFTAADFAARTESAKAAWADDAVLDRVMTVPWGQVQGRGILWAYTNEFLVHGWDLAVATGQAAEADQAVAEATAAVARVFIPAEIRTDPGVPFDTVVEPRADAGATERLANWAGHRSTGWV